MTAFLTVLLFPAIAGLGFGLVYSLMGLFFGMRSGRLLVRYGGWIYLAFLTPPVWLAWLEATRRHELSDLGLCWPEGGLAWTAVPVGLVSGYALFLGELVLSSLLMRALPADNPMFNVVEGRSRQLVEHAPGALAYLGCSALIASAEEFLWRGFLPHFMTTRLEVQLPVALAVSSASFGLNHSYYGLRNVVLKTLDGASWALLALAFSSLVPAVVSHCTFQFFVWRRLRRQAAAA